MKKIKIMNGLTGVAVAIITFWLISINYSEMFSDGNRGAFLGIVSMLFLIVVLNMEKRRLVNKKRK